MIFWPIIKILIMNIILKLELKREKDQLIIKKNSKMIILLIRRKEISNIQILMYSTL